MTNLPVDPSSGGTDGSSSDDGPKFLSIGTLNYQANDIAELGKLAERNPDLAHKIVEQRETEGRREHRSYRFALIVTSALILGIIASLTYLLSEVGPWATVGVIGVFLVIAAFLRVILTGEWSETSWVGVIVKAIVGRLGGKPRSDSDKAAE